MIYLDNAATTQIAPEVLDAMMPYLTTEYGNAGTLYGFGREAKKAVEKAREQVAEFVGAESPEHIIFTSGGSESNNMVINNWKELAKRTGNRNIITTSIEHDSIYKAIENTMKPVFHIHYLHPDSDGYIKINELDSALSKIGRDRTLVNIMFVNNEIGACNAMYTIGNVCAKYGALLHTDGVQAAGETIIDAGFIKYDTLSLSSHKIHGPKGVGALYRRDLNREFAPLVFGGEMQEFGKRGGTENVAGIVGFGAACDLLTKNRNGSNRLVYICDLKSLFWDTLCTEMKSYGIGDLLCTNANSEDLANGKILNFRVKGIDAETMVLYLGTHGVCVSAGSACRSLEQEPSRVLLEIGLKPDEARESIRVSFSRFNTKEEVVEAARIIAEAVNMLV